MHKKNLTGTIIEVVLIVALAATAGVAWNRTLLTRAWHGELTQQAEAAAPAAEQLPMPIAMQQVKEMLDAKQAVIVDARSSADYAQGHISGAIAMPLAEARKPSTIASTLKAPKDTVIIAYCNGFSCHDSMDLGKLLMRAGYASVYVYEGGFPEWRDAGYPVKKEGT